MIPKIIFTAVLIVVPVAARAQAAHAKTIACPSYRGLVMAGYQGWFRTPDDGVMYPDETKVRINMWPDVNEYVKTCPTSLKHTDGSAAILAGAGMIYVAMFDEVNEGTAIFKCTDNPPVSDVAKFVGMDGCPSDWYLWLTGEAAKMLRSEKPLSIAMPERKQ